MSKIANPTKVITGVNTRRSYANVWDPKSINGAAPKYSVSLIIPKSDTVTVNKIKAAIQAAYEEGESKLKGTAKVCPALDVIKTPLRDGDKERPGDEAYKDSYGANRTGRWAGRLIQLQNLPQNHMYDLDAARELVRIGDYDSLSMLYDDIPDTLSQLIRTAFIAKPGYKFYVADFSAIEARVIAHLARESWRAEVFKNGGDIYCTSASQMFHVPVEKHGINGHLRQKGKIADLALGYGGSVGALKAMGALEMGLTEDELQPLVDAWRQSNPNIVALWWDFDTAIKNAIKMHCSTASHGIKFTWRSGMLFITLPSGRKLTYVKPRIGENKFGGESVTYEGIGATKKWERLESYGPKFVENVVQAISRDLLMNAMKTLSHCFICGHVHDKLIIECSEKVSLKVLCQQMARTPDWMPDILLRADGYVTEFYKKD